MGIIKSAGDLVYTFRFLTLLTTPFENTKAYEYGIIDIDGKRNKNYSLNTLDARDAYSNYYTPFHRLVFNIKRLMAKVPGGGSRLASYAAALYLIKEKYNLSDNTINKALKAGNIDPLDILAEDTQWFLLEDKRLSPGVYYVKNEKVLNQNCDDIVLAKDKVKILENSYPVGNILGLDVYNAIHVKTQQSIYVTVAELVR